MKLFMIFAAVIAAMYRFKLRHSAKYSERVAKGKDRPRAPEWAVGWRQVLGAIAICIVFFFFGKKEN